MLADLTARQIEGWRLWMTKTQPRPDRMDWAWGTLLAITHNAHAEARERKSPLDFMPYHDRFEDITLDELKGRLGLA